MMSVIQQAEAAHHRGELDEAKRLYTQQLQASARDVDALYGLGTLSMQVEHFVDAVPLLAQAIALAPEAAEIAYNYAVCLQRVGDLSMAVQLAEQAGGSAGTDEGFSLAVCQLLLRLDAPRALLKQLGRFPHQALASHILQSQALGLLGAWDRAVALLRQLSQLYPSNVEVVRELSLAAARLRDYELAIASFGHYLGLITPGAEEYVQYADLFLLAREADQCAEYLRRASDAGADSADYHLLRGRLARLRGDYALAMNACESVLEQQPHNAQAWSVRLEIAPLGTLPALIQRLQVSLDMKSMPAYEQQLIEYVQADAYARLDDVELAFRCYASANARQKAGLQVQGTDYDMAASTAGCDSLLRQFKHRGQTAVVTVGRATPLFILGMPRSGTTLVERLLAQLPMVSAGGENEAMGFLVTQYQRDIQTGKLPLPANMTPPQWQALAQAYYEKTPGYQSGAAAADAGLFMTDKMPQNFQHVGMILSTFPAARVIQMRRDPRDVCWSIFTRMFHAGHNYACDFESLAHAYAVSRQLMDHWAALAPDRVLDVSYEALVADPLVQGQRITDFCELPWSARCLDFHKTISTSFTFSELQVREAINEHRIGRWQPFERQLAPLVEALQRYGCLD
jgi:tetratricopeptide (TPR) repeat protein